MLIQWKPGIDLPETCMVTNMPMSEYLAHPALGASRFKDFIARGPRYWAMKHVHKTFPEKQSEDLEFGKAFEAFVCDGEQAVRGLFRFWPAKYLSDGSKNPEYLMTTVEGKAWAAKMGKPTGCKMEDWTHEQGKPQLDQETIPIMQAMLSSLQEHPVYELIRDCETQVTMFGVLDTPNGPLRIKSRPDFFLFTGDHRTEFLPTSIDLKALKAKDFEGGIRARTLIDYCYELQACICRELAGQNGVPHSNHHLLLCEKDIPHTTEHVRLSAGFLDLARKRLMQAATRLAGHVHNDDWPRTSGELVELDAPVWYRGKITEEY